MFGGGNIDGAGHGDDICYVFRWVNSERRNLLSVILSNISSETTRFRRCPVADKVYEDIRENTDEDSKIALQTIQNMAKLYTNFAKYGY